MYNTNKAGLTNVTTILQKPQTTDTKNTSRGARVAVRGAHKSFGNNHVLIDLDLDIAPGEFVAVVGRSGCGKSTLLRLLAGLEPASSGLVAIDDAPLRALHPDVRVMFQDARLMPWMHVLENAGLGLNGDWKPKAQAALDDVGLGDRGGDWPAILSGGQRQRVALARALASHPRFLLLDEPLGALDALTRPDMQRLIEDLWRQRGFTTLLITHDAEEAVALADRVVLIQNGVISVDIPIELPRPRDRASAEFIALREEILRHVRAAE
ncbi:MAG: aliphatic sulfonates transporter ATP-binding protein [Capsulimonas sp.]|nr:aliphatic sulfonates transporter ATP-binding protein [Capsulimonas sp.]